MKLASNKKVIKFPRDKGSVASTLRRAAQRAKEQEWSKIIIIGEGKKRGSTLFSVMSDNTRYGLMFRSAVRGMIQDEKDGF